MLKGIKLLLYTFRSAVRVGLIYIRVYMSANITVYFIIVHFYTDNSCFSICVIVDL